MGSAMDGDGSGRLPGGVPFLPAAKQLGREGWALERSAQSVLRDAEAGLSPVGLEPLFEAFARAAVFISESPLPTGSR